MTNPMAIYGVATPGTVPTWSIAVPFSGGPLRITAGGASYDAARVMLRVTTSPPIANKTLGVIRTLVYPVGDDQWALIFGGTFFNSLSNMTTDANGVLTVIISRDQLYSAVWMPPGGPDPYPSARMDFQVQTGQGEVVEFQLELARI